MFHIAEETNNVEYLVKSSKNPPLTEGTEDYKRKKVFGTLLKKRRNSNKTLTKCPVFHCRAPFSDSLNAN
jgi:hypothetical protein